MRVATLILLSTTCSVWADKPQLVVPPPLHPREVSGERADPGPGVNVDYQKNTISRREAGGKLLWSTHVEGHLRSVRDPGILHDKDRLYLSHGDGITALDMKTGKVVWAAKGPNDRLHLSGKLLLAVECSSDEELLKRGRWLIARDRISGAEVFKVGLPAKEFDAHCIRKVAGLFLVQASVWARNGGNAYLIDDKGKIVHQFGRDILDGRMVGDDRVFLTGHSVFRVTPGGKEVWSIELDERHRLSQGAFLELPGGDLLCHRYCPISDSGVELRRINPKTGKTVWADDCAPLGVGHSKYHHDAKVVVEKDNLRITSRGSGGSFVELRDLKSGKRIERASSKP